MVEFVFDVEVFVGFVVVEDVFVVVDLGGNVIEGLDEVEVEFFVLLIFSNSDVFDVVNVVEVMDVRKGEEIMLVIFIYDLEKMLRGGRKMYNFFLIISVLVLMIEFCDWLVFLMIIM